MLASRLSYHPATTAHGSLWKTVASESTRVSWYVQQSRVAHEVNAAGEMHLCSEKVTYVPPGYRPMG